MLLRKICLQALFVQTLLLVLDLGQHQGVNAQNLRLGSRRQQSAHVRRRFLHCHEEGSASSPASNILDALLDGGLLSSQNGTQTSVNETHDTASDRFEDADGEFGSGQSVGVRPTSPPMPASLSPSTSPPSPASCPEAETEDEVSCQEGTLNFPSLCHAKQALGDQLTGCILVNSEPLVRDDDAGGPSPPDSCPDAEPDEKVSCQQGTLTFPSLCHAKLELGDRLTGCILVDSDPLVGAPARAQANDDPIDPAIADPSQEQSEEVSLASLDCSEVGGEAKADKVPVICSGDMIFASWCDALRRGFTVDDCRVF